MRTIGFTVGLKDERPSNLLSSPQCGSDGQVLSALAEIGRQLQSLASAYQGERDFRVHVSPPARHVTRLSVVELVNLFLLTKARSGKSDRYVRALHYTLAKFIEGRANRYADEICLEEIEKWLFSLGHEPRTLENYLGDVRTLFNFGIKRGLLKENPARGIELPEYEPDAVTTHDPATVKAVLDFARGYDLDICRALAVRYFAGVRTVEAERMSDALIGERYIEITREVCKGARARRRRLITIQPNLREWLKLGGSLPAPPQNGRRSLEFMRALAAAGHDWPHNVTRHSFCSYHLAKFGDISKLILESGHTEEMLFGHYREVKTPEAGNAYFDIIP